ncbi:MAG: hypothetical protein LQ346_008357 [Caloplaca aetnensis]|nr:MAG: hypothetical protein LQ346_008357 [Caloplaca aetnensis]
MAAPAIPALPVINPGWAEIHRCDQRFGFGILPSDCQTAGSFLPQGWDQIVYRTLPGLAPEEFTLPWSKTIGTCTLTVELAGPLIFETSQVNLVPNVIRGMAGYVISQCPGGGDEEFEFGAGLGGYVTSGMDRLYEWLSHAATFINPTNPWSSMWPNSRTQFVTVTVQRETTKSKAPGDTDVGVAEKVLQFAGELWDEQQSGVRKNFLFSLSELLWVKVQEMTGREDIYWFDPIRLRREMEYTCDMKLEGPAVVDCAKLEYHGLGHGVVEFDKGETKYFNQDSCALAVSANRPMTLTWDQINIAFDALLNLCVDRPFFAARGGHATFSRNPKELFGRKMRKGKRDDDIGGTNALPQGARIDLWKHGGKGARLDCEFAAVLRGQKLDQCAKP